MKKSLLLALSLFLNIHVTTLHGMEENSKWMPALVLGIWITCEILSHTLKLDQLPSDDSQSVNPYKTKINAHHIEHDQN